MVSFKSWHRLYKKYKNSDMSNPSIRKAFNLDFTSLSEDYWIEILNDTNSLELARSLSKVWFKEKNYILSSTEAYEKALERLEYSSDRMTYNRWLHIRYLLNLDIQ